MARAKGVTGRDSRGRIRTLHDPLPKREAGEAGTSEQPHFLFSIDEWKLILPRKSDVFALSPTYIGSPEVVVLSDVSLQQPLYESRVARQPRSLRSRVILQKTAEAFVPQVCGAEEERSAHGAQQQGFLIQGFDNVRAPSRLLCETLVGVLVSLRSLLFGCRELAVEIGIWRKQSARSQTGTTAE
ncbi:unnamed protein product [Pleuronectes platessa]|uniref:Uncharacterized protein n=1 Tax=Pleuronectes platessa TaxID=8262 RepID=A0A9N7U504_PLEPL|nr:unnamed protein product [Pleuronectes platessa]